MAWQHSTVLDCRLSFLHLPSGRCGHSMCVYGNSLVLFAGFDGSKWLNDLHILNTVSLVWTQPRVSGPLPEVRQYHSAVMLRDHMYVFGGYNGLTWLCDLQALHLPTVTWKRLKASGSPPTAKEGHAMVAWGTWLYVFGGWDGEAVGHLHRFSTEQNVWEDVRVGGRSPTVCGHSMSLVEDALYVFGGYTGNGWSNAMYRLDLTALHPQWQELSVQGEPKARGYHSSVIVSRFILIYAGYNGTHILGDLLAFDTEMRAWSFPDPFSQHSLEARNAHTMTKVGSELYLFGGYNGFRDTNDLHILESAAFSTLHDDIAKVGRWEQWKDVALISGSEARRVHRAILRSRCPLLYIESELVGEEWRVQLPRLSLAGLEAFCDFLYTDGVRIMNVPRVREDLSLLASTYSLLRLRQLCDDVFDSSDSTFASDIMEIRSFVDLSDLTIVVEEQVFHTHRFILACRCPYFRALLQSPMKEQAAGVLRLEGMSSEAFAVVLDWIYSDKFSPLFADAGIDVRLGLLLLRDASVLQLDCLVRMTEISLQKQTTLTNVCALLDFSITCSALKLRSSCLSFLLKNFERVDKRDLSELSPEAKTFLKTHLPKSLQKQADLQPTRAVLVKLDSHKDLPLACPMLLNIKGEKLGSKPSFPSSKTFKDRTSVSFRERNNVSLGDTRMRQTVFVSQASNLQTKRFFTRTGLGIVGAFHRSFSGLM